MYEENAERKDDYLIDDTAMVYKTDDGIYNMNDLVNEMEKLIVNASGSRLDLGWGSSVDIPENNEI